MLLHGAPLWLLGAALGSFVPGAFHGLPSHSLSYFYLHLPEPSRRLSQFLIRSYLDDQPIARFDSLTGKMEPLVPWMEEVEKEAFLSPGWVFRTGQKLSERDLQAAGPHTWQAVLGCELREDGSTGGFFRYGYDGRDFISFDKETLTWVAAQPQARKVKEEWEEDPGWSERNKFFLEETCIEWLHRYLSYKNKTQERTEPPVGNVTRKMVDERLEVLTCQAFGFYPKEIQATWRRDGEIWEHKTFRRNVAPNSDGTYYLWLSIEIDPKERDRFRCHLEHVGLQEPLDLPWKEKTASGWLIPVGIVAGLIPGAEILFLIGWFLYWLCRSRRNNHYQEVAPCHDRSPSQRVPPSPEDVAEDDIRSPLLPKSTSEHKASYGVQRSRSDPGASASPLCRQEGKGNAKWKTWDGSQPSASVNTNWPSEDTMKAP